LSASLEKLQQCCVCDPIWIFVYSDGSIFSICEKDFKSAAYRLNVIEVINIESQQSFKPEEIFGGPGFGKF